MYCPTCGSEERQLSQYCRACGTDLRVVRMGLEQPDSITASAVSAREQIGRAMAEKIRETQSTKDLKKVAEDVLPQIEKFLESPAEKRLRRLRAGVIMAAIGFAVTLVGFFMTMGDGDFAPMMVPGTVLFFIGLGIIINGLVFTVPRSEVADLSESAVKQKELDHRAPSALPASSMQSATNELGVPEPTGAHVSVTEHTTHHLKPKQL